MRPISITDLTARRRTIDVQLPVELGVMTVTYRPYNAAIEKKWLETSVLDIGRVEKLAIQLADILLSWDVENNGQTVPPNKETLVQFDAQVLNAIFNAIIADMTPQAPKELRVNSGDGS